MDQLAELFNKYNLSEYFNEIKPLVKNSIRLNLIETDEENIKFGQTKIGGSPDLPDGTQWFKNTETGWYMHFICQINFEEAKPYDTENELPEKGILYFFYDCNYDGGMKWGFDPKDRSGFKVLYYNGDMSNLKRTAAPSEISTGKYETFKATAVEFESRLSIPDLCSIYSENIKYSFSDEEFDNYYDLLDELGTEQNKILGHSENIQGSMEDECQLVTNGVYCGNVIDRNDEKIKQLISSGREWELLFQIFSNEENNMMWGDMGMLYLWIRKEDLRNKNFDKCWLICQCG